MLVREFFTMLLVAFILINPSSSSKADQGDPRLEALFAELAVTGSADRAAALESRIWKIWLDPPPGRDVAAAWQRGLRTMSLGQGHDAMRAFDSVVALAPDFAEGWNKRATVRYVLGDLTGSVEDIRRTLALEPRHFGALSGLGLIRLAQDRPGEALDAFEAALKIHPNLPGMVNIEALREKVHGKPL